MAARTDQGSNRGRSGQGRSQGRTRGQGGQGGQGRQPADRFAFPGIAYELRPHLPISQTAITPFFQVIAAMAALDSDAQVPGIAICDWAGFHCGPASGHAARRRGTLLRFIEASPGASNSARQYHQDSPHMDNDEAAATGKLVLAEDQVLRYLGGQKIDLGRLAETLELVAIQFSSLEGCHKLEGGARAMWAWVLIRQAIDRRTGKIDLFKYAQSVEVMREAITLLSTAYRVPNATTIAQQIGLIDVKSLETQPSGLHTSDRSRSRVTA